MTSVTILPYVEKLAMHSTFDSNSSRINIFDVFPNETPESTDTEPEVAGLDDEQQGPNPKKRAELYQWLNTSYYGSIIRKVSGQPAYIPDYATVRLEENSTLPVFENDEEYCAAAEETNSLLEQHKIQVEPIAAASSTEHTSTESYELCKSCTARYTRHRTTRHARIIWLIVTTVALSVSFFPYGLFSVVLLLFIPPQIRRPICKKCRTSFWGF
ncbi:unnamed protein product [Caenorhabditis sp. 36 PRJEB53466]|nr:unnamed protein product [Caenorhabditis sp. 36 PRJEB53466]